YLIKSFSLFCICLEKRFGANLKLEIFEPFNDMPFSKINLGLKVCQRIIFFKIDCVKQRSNVRKVSFYEFENVIPLCLFVFAKYRVYHYFTGCTNPYLEISQKAFVFTVIVKT